MKCNKCGSQMILLFTSFVCDTCNPPACDVIVSSKPNVANIPSYDGWYFGVVACNSSDIDYVDKKWKYSDVLEHETSIDDYKLAFPGYKTKGIFVWVKSRKPITHKRVLTANIPEKTNANSVMFHAIIGQTKDY